MPDSNPIVRIGWSATELSRRTGVHERTCRRWAAGEATIPPPVEAWLRRVADAIERVGPAPQPGGQRSVWAVVETIGTTQRVVSTHSYREEADSEATRLRQRREAGGSYGVVGCETKD